MGDIELGGNDPAIVLPDVDPHAVAQKLFWGAFANSGQVCIAIKRPYVHEDVYQPNLNELTELARSVKLGPGTDPATQLGPINNRAQFERVQELVEDARSQGGKVVVGGAPLAPGAPRRSATCRWSTSRAEGAARTRRAFLLACALLLALACAQEADDRIAPELSGGVGWLNTARPLSLAELRGQVVLIDFWTYCCINCMHVLPDLHWLEEKYRDEPFVVIGVHSAKFEDEGDAKNIAEAIQRYEIEHPVYVDNEFAVWKRYGAHSWPTLVFVDPEGRIAHKVPGEPSREQLDRAVSTLLAEARTKGTLAAKRVEIPPAPSELQTGPLAFPGKVHATADGRVFIADSSHNRIVIADATGKLLDVIGSGLEGRTDGDYASASFHHPQGMFVDGPVLWVADTENHLIRAVDLDARRVSTVAGTGKLGRSVHRKRGDPAHTDLRSPWDVLARDGTLYIAMAGTHQLWTLPVQSGKAAGTIGAWAGSGREEIIDGPLMKAAFAQPSAFALDGTTLYVADSETSSIRAIDLVRGNVTTVVGKGLFEFGDEDGAGEQVRLQHALGVASAGPGQLYVADTYNSKVKIVGAAQRTSRTLAQGLNEPGGLAFTGDTLYVADTNAHRVVRVDTKTGALAAFEIAGLEPPPLRGVSELPGPTTPAPPASTQTLAESRVAPGRVEVRLDLDLPEGVALTEGAPLRVSVSSSGSGLTPSSADVRAPQRADALPLSLPTVDVSPGARGALVVDVRAYACTKGDAARCFPVLARLTQPLTAGGDVRSITLRMAVDAISD